jgi:PTH1 family peptidyl-tRNA hydrolase
MKLIVGLGNPGEEYKNNRHNVGFMFVDYLLKNQRLRIKDQNDNLKFKNNKYLLSNIYSLSHNVILAKPQTFMNKSGDAVKKLTTTYSLSPSDLIIIHDDLDIPLGKFHIQKSVGPKLHNGIESIEKILKTKDFLRVRIGVDNRLPEKRINGETYVLQNFLEKEKTIINQTFPEIIKASAFFKN